MSSYYKRISGRHAIHDDSGHLHDVPDTPVMVVNGGELHVLGQTKIELREGGVRVDFTCLVVRELTQ